MLSRLAVSLIASALTLVHFAPLANRGAPARILPRVSRVRVADAHYRISVDHERYEAEWSPFLKTARFRGVLARVSDADGKPVSGVTVNAKCEVGQEGLCDPGILSSEVSQVTSSGGGFVVFHFVISSQTKPRGRWLSVVLYPGGPDKSLFPPHTIHLVLIR